VLGIALALVCALTTTARSQQKLLTLDDIYDPQRQTNFSGMAPSRRLWMDSTRFAALRAQGAEWTAVDAVTGAGAPLFDAKKMEDALARLPGFPRTDARRLARSRQLVFDHKFSSALVTFATDLYLYTFASDRALRLTSAAGDELLPSFSPDDTMIGFVRDNNLFVVDVASGRERQITGDGTPKILNGILDWVYEEEIYGRGDRRAYWWSPDSTRLAFLQLDDTPVPTFATVDSIPYDPAIETWSYPKAGDPNPIARLGVVQSIGGSITWVDAGKYTPSDTLIVRVGWAPDSRRVVYEVQNRTQTWLDLNTWDVGSEKAHPVFRESSPHWISSEDASEPFWLKDGSFLWLSERSGWRHVYHYTEAGALVGQVTRGNWEVRAVHGVDEAGGWLYFSGTADSPIGLDVYRIRLNGASLERLSPVDGTHTARFNPPLTMFFDRWSDVTTPARTSLRRSDGSELRVLDVNNVTALEEYRLAKPEFVRVPTRDGFVMEAMMIKPPDFDPSRKYPVYQFTYAGPHIPQVRNAWGGTEYMYHQLLAQNGIIVWICDNRTASGKGAESMWPLERRFGEIELRDIEDGINWLTGQSFVDPARIGLHGWSYGGFMTAYAMTHSRLFSMGIAGGTVADWRDYDSVYTERYLGLPQDNPEGYRNSSPRWSAASLSGALLLIHGEIDDNVHISNTMQFAYELQRAQKPFQLMVYPKSRHSVSDPLLARHLRSTMLDFVLDHLRPGERN
jgi:dipeptidyl-peptidase-4